jgi:hypothetical protein
MCAALQVCPMTPVIHWQSNNSGSGSVILRGAGRERVAMNEKGPALPGLFGTITQAADYAAPRQAQPLTASW